MDSMAMMASSTKSPSEMMSAPNVIRSKTRSVTIMITNTAPNVSGIAATVGSGLIVWWAFMPPWHSWTGKDPKNVLAALIFAFMSVAVSLLQQRLRNLADQRRLLAALIENSSDFIGLADPSRKPVYLNPAGRAMVGLDDETPMAGHGLLEFYAPSVRDTALGEIEPSTITLRSPFLVRKMVSILAIPCPSARRVNASRQWLISEGAMTSPKWMQSQGPSDRHE